MYCYRNFKERKVTEGWTIQGNFTGGNLSWFLVAGEEEERKKEMPGSTQL